MTSQELYYKFSLLVNRNAKFDNSKVNIPNFVLLFNREKDRWLSKFIKENNNNIDIHDLQELYEEDVELHLVKTKKGLQQDTYYYKLPADYFEFASSQSYAEKEDCQTYIPNFLFKPRDKNTLIEDAFSSPSFEFQEGLCNISNAHLLIYAKDYIIKSSHLSYYKQVPAIDIEGYVNIDKTPSKTINPTLSDENLEQILSLTVTEVMREFKDQVGFQLSTERERI